MNMRLVKDHIIDDGDTGMTVRELEHRLIASQKQPVQEFNQVWEIEREAKRLEKQACAWFMRGSMGDAMLCRQQALQMRVDLANAHKTEFGRRFMESVKSIAREYGEPKPNEVEVLG